jgi:hypothetical protein
VAAGHDGYPLSAAGHRAAAIATAHETALSITPRLDGSG